MTCLVLPSLAGKVAAQPTDEFPKGELPRSSYYGKIKKQKGSGNLRSASAFFVIFCFYSADYTDKKS